jgi:hypothetical protein
VDAASHSKPGWRNLYISGATAALLAAVLFRRNWSAEVFLLREFGVITVGPAVAPVRAAGWFELLGTHPILGLVMLDFLDVVNYALVGVLLLALYGALRRLNRGAMLAALAAGLVGVGLSFASNQAFGMLTLSTQHAAAATAAERALFQAAGEALLAQSNPATAQMSQGVASSFFLVTSASLIASVVMLRSDHFGGATAWVGIVAHAILLGRFVTIPLPLAYSAIPPSLAAPLLIVWNVMVAIRLIRLARA